MNKPMPESRIPGHVIKIELDHQRGGWVWRIYHDEHCQWDWPHAETCHLTPPAVLEYSK